MHIVLGVTCGYESAIPDLLEGQAMLFRRRLEVMHSVRPVEWLRVNCRVVTRLEIPDEIN